MEARLLNFKVHGDERGNLIALEQAKEIPFNIQRIYYIYGTQPGIVRGKHAHKALEQVLVCVHGKCKILLDDGHEKKEVLLDSPDRGLYIPNNVWREMYDFSDEAVLLVIASKKYDEADYIRDYKEFLLYVK